MLNNMTFLETTIKLTSKGFHLLPHIATDKSKSTRIIKQLYGDNAE
jgi:hypothetical protein